MKIVCAPDSFKETLGATDAVAAIARGVADADPQAEVDECPVGDGGEGTLEALMTAMNGTRHNVVVIGPRGTNVKATFGVSSDQKTGIVELAQASGLALLPANRRDPTLTTTYGTGQLIQAAVDEGCTTVIVCIGGSATCDGAAGLAQALGVQFLDSAGNRIAEPLIGGTLQTIASIKPPEKKLPNLRIACDVTNPLLGVNGAAAIYGPQKGATQQQVAQLDDALAHLASLTNLDPQFPGAGAAGGAGFGLVAFCNAKLERGIDLVLDAARFDERVRDADLVITGEGRLDGQSLAGKATIGVARAALRHNAPTIAIVGSTGQGAHNCLIRDGVNGALYDYRSLSDRFGRDRAMNDTAAALRELTAEVVREFINAHQ